MAKKLIEAEYDNDIEDFISDIAKIIKYSSINSNCKEISDFLKGILGVKWAAVIKTLQTNAKPQTILDLFESALFCEQDTPITSRGCKMLNDNSLLVDNTLIFVINKAVGQNVGVNPSDLYSVIYNSLSSLKNSRSLLFSYIIRNILSNEIPHIGYGLSNVNEEAIIYKANSYIYAQEDNPDKDGLKDFVVGCITCDIVDLIKKSIDEKTIIKLFCEKNRTVTNKDLHQLNSALSFMPKEYISSEKRKIYTGDIFKVNYIQQDDKDEQKEVENKDVYLICVSKGCDCAHPEDKNEFQYAFAKGYIVGMEDSLKNAETEYYTYLWSEDKAIKWTKKFFSINLEAKNIYEINKDIDVIFKDKPARMIFIGYQKEPYAQRIVNFVFNTALKIGADLATITESKINAKNDK